MTLVSSIYFCVWEIIGEMPVIIKIQLFVITRKSMHSGGGGEGSGLVIFLILMMDIGFSNGKKRNNGMDYIQ